MGSLKGGKRLIVNADDFGKSRSINDAIIQAHREGILTTASLMVNGSAYDHAVELAHQNPQLGVGLHLTLVCGRSILKPTEIRGLVNERYEFSQNPVTTGLRYFFLPGLRYQLRHEIQAQFQRFALTGLTLDHVNGHLNMHLHPTVFSLLKHHYQDWQLKHFRLTRDPFWLNARLASGAWAYRLSHAFIYMVLCGLAEEDLQRRQIKHTRWVFGLLQNGRMNEQYITRLLPRLPDGDSELYSHPSMDEFKHEFDALISPRVKELVQQQGIELIRYQDL